MTTTITNLDDFKALDPFFRIIEKGLDGFADGGHFFDLLAEKLIFDMVDSKSGRLMGPLGFEPRTDGLKVSESRANAKAYSRCQGNGSGESGIP
jgi:uncharacterized protein